MFWSDIRFGFRLLKRSPVFGLTAVLLLGVGIGANTLIFSFVNALLLRPLPVEHPEQLVRLIEVHPTNFVTWDMPYLLCERLTGAASVSEPFCQGDLDVAFTDGATAERIRVNAVSRNFFSALGIHAQLGRVLTPEDDKSGALTAVVSDAFWRKRLGGPPAVIGSVIHLNSRAFTVVGVLPAEVNGVTVDISPAVRIPLTAERVLAGDGLNYALLRFQVFGRLKPGVTLQRANAEVDPLLRKAHEEGLFRAFPELARGNRGNALNSRLQFESITYGVSTLRERFSRGLVLLLALAGLLLLMACANVACLLLARAEARNQEIAIRFALGASRWRVARQLLTEGLAIAIPGGVLGVGLTYACRPLLVAALPPIRDRSAVLQPLAVHADIDGRVLAFAVLACLLTALLSGISPALRGARSRGSRTVTARLSGRNILVMAQVAICVLLLAGASLLMETFDRMETMNAGFDQGHVATFTVDPGLKGYTGEQSKLLSQRLLEGTRALPGVEASAIASIGVMHGTGMKGTVNAAGKPVIRNDFLNCSLNSVTPGYFDTIGIPILAGRDFRWTGDDTEKPKKAIVNLAFARHFFPGENAVGKLFGGKGAGGLAARETEIVGVVGDAKYRSLREDVPPTSYGPVLHGFDSEFILHVRTREAPAAMIGPVRKVLRSLDPELPLIEAHTLREEVETSLWQERLLAALSALFSSFAALLAGIGLYGALDLSVKARTREIGVRVALGAEPVRVIWLLAKEMLLVVVAGAIAGIAMEALSARWIRQALYDVAPSDPAALSRTLLFVTVIAIAAAAPPIWRAVGIDPASALRHE